jgi:SAM-dependent methyltransferase
MGDSSDTPRDAAYWQVLYDENDMGWDKGIPAPPFVSFLKEQPFSKGSRVLVPGCGLGHEVLFLARLGYEVTAVDFAQGAIEGLRSRIGELPVSALQKDIFSLPEDHADSFDVVLEHTCFCAIPLEMRSSYAAVMQSVLKHGGRLVGLFYETDAEEGPPFRTTRQHIVDHFEKHFEITRIERPTDSFEGRVGKELFVEMKKRN